MAISISSLTGCLANGRPSVRGRHYLRRRGACQALLISTLCSKGRGLATACCRGVLQARLEPLLHRRAGQRGTLRVEGQAAPQGPRRGREVCEAPGQPLCVAGSAPLPARRRADCRALLQRAAADAGRIHLLLLQRRPDLSLCAPHSAMHSMKFYARNLA